jgi:hypothetical protein
MNIIFELRFDPNDVDSNEGVEHLLFGMESETRLEIDIEITDDRESDLFSKVIKGTKDDVKSWLSEYLEEADNFMVESNFADFELTGKDYTMMYVNVEVIVADSSESFLQPVSYFFDEIEESF